MTHKKNDRGTALQSIRTIFPLQRISDFPAFSSYTSFSSTRSSPCKRLTRKATLALKVALGLRLCLGLRHSLRRRGCEECLCRGAESRIWTWRAVRGRCCLRGGRWADARLGLLHQGLSEALSLLARRRLLLPLCGAGYLSQGRLLEGSRLEGLVRGRGAAADRRAQQGV